MFTNNNRHGSIAQLGEHLPYKQRVTGSSPVVPTIIECVQNILHTPSVIFLQMSCDV